jgi:small subunit ribosomal protein S17
LKKEMFGLVVSDKMDKTIVVEVERLVKHRLYDKRIKKRRKFKAHDEKNEARSGDRVRVVENMPVSRTKRWRFAEIIERAEER